MRYIWFFLGLGTTLHLFLVLFTADQFPEPQIARYFAFITAVASIPLIITWRRDIRENPTGFVALILTTCFALDFVVHNSTSLTLLALYVAPQIFNSTRSVLAKALHRSTPEPLA